MNVTVVETRGEALEGMPAGVATKLTSVPEEMVRSAPAGAAFVVLTHDHALDFLIVAEALKRTDAAYVGMIGSKTKKATFRSWFLKSAGGNEADFSRLVSPDRRRYGERQAAGGHRSARRGGNHHGARRLL